MGLVQDTIAEGKNSWRAIEAKYERSLGPFFRGPNVAPGLEHYIGPAVLRDGDDGRQLHELLAAMDKEFSEWRREHIRDDVIETQSRFVEWIDAKLLLMEMLGCAGGVSPDIARDLYAEAVTHAGRVFTSPRDHMLLRRLDLDPSDPAVALKVIRNWCRPEPGRGEIMTRMRAAIRDTEKNGEHAKPEVVITCARVNKQSGRNALRELERLGEYHGFTRRCPSKYVRR